MLELIAAGVNTDSSVNHLKALHPSLGDCSSLQQVTTSLLDSAADGLSASQMQNRSKMATNVFSCGGRFLAVAKVKTKVCAAKEKMIFTWPEWCQIFFYI